MTFHYPIILLGLLLLPLFGAFSLWRSRKRQQDLTLLGDEALVRPLIASVDYGRRWRKLWLRLGALGMLILASARPMWGLAEELITAEGIAMMVVLDVSNSMDAMDTSPSRIERAKFTAATLFESYRGHPVGLVLFAGDAFVQFPLTHDVQSALTFLDAASTDSITRQGTAVGEALTLALDTLDERIASRSVIVLMTDGENHEGSPLDAAERAQAEGVIIHVIGYGSPEGTTIPILNEQGEVIGAKADNAGNLVVTRLNELPLRQIADITGGIYRSASEAGIEVVDILNATQNLSAQEAEERLQVRQVDRFPLFVFVALGLLFADMMTTERRTG